jgi:hypothetical protein
MDILYTESSPFQHIMILEENGKTKSLALDGVPQTTLPNTDYWECLLGPNNGESVVILGGGDLTSIPVLKRRKVENFSIIEIDKMVIEACSLFVGVPRGEWGDKIIIADAVEKLKEGLNPKPEHLCIDMLAITRLDVLVGVNPKEFLDLLVENAEKYISGFTETDTTGIILNDILRREFYRRGWKFFISMIDELGHVFFTVSRDKFYLPPEMESTIIRYPIYPKDERLYEFSFNDALLIIKEAK